MVGGFYVLQYYCFLCMIYNSLRLKRFNFSSLQHLINMAAERVVAHDLITHAASSADRSEAANVSEACRFQLAAAKEAARRTILLSEGVSPEEVERRIAQARSSREEHAQRLADPIVRARFEEFSKEQSRAAKALAGTAGRPQPPKRDDDLENSILSLLRTLGTKTALEIAKATCAQEERHRATKAYANPTLYRMQAKGLLTQSAAGWSLNELPTTRALILEALDKPAVAYNVLELSALVDTPLPAVRSVLAQLLDDGAITSREFTGLSGAHQYFSLYG